MITHHKKQWEFLKRKCELNQLSHAYLFSGQKEVGKRDFALNFAEFLECKFPDLLIVEPEEEISIKKIREIQNFLSYKSYNGSFKIVVVNKAEKMNQEAQSCFLKTLEEPKGKTLIILISSNPDMLLSTIISRCQIIKFFKIKNLSENLEKLEKDKKILNDLLLIINSNFSEKFKYVKSISAKTESASEEDYKNKDISYIIENIQKYLRHLLMIKIGVNKPNIKDEQFKKYSIEDLKRILNLIEDINKKLIFTNASPKLALEILLLEL